MNRNKLFGAFVAGLLASASPAVAADYNSGVVTEGPESSYTHVEYGSGWYLRGDVGAIISVDSNLSYVTDIERDYTSQSIDADYSVSVGAGYIFNDFLRADLMLDVFGGGSFSGTRSDATVAEPTGCGAGETGECFSNDDVDYDITSIGINLYGSLGRWGPISPYAGAGIGLAHVQWDDYTTTPVCVLDPGETCTLGVHSGGAATETFTGPTSTLSAGDSVNLSYALMFGADYKVDENWTIDVGYRMTHISGDTVVSSIDSDFDGLTLHEVRAGLRYEIW